MWPSRVPKKYSPKAGHGRASPPVAMGVGAHPDGANGSRFWKDTGLGPGKAGGGAQSLGRAGVSPVPLQVEEEPGRSHLPEKHQESAGGAGGEARPGRALGLARGEPPTAHVPLSLILHPSAHRLNGTHLRPLSLVPNDKARDWAVLQVFGPQSIPGHWAALALHPEPHGSHVRERGSEHRARGVSAEPALGL